MKAYPNRRVNRTQGTVFATKTGARAALGVYLVRIDPLAHTGTVKHFCVLIWATGHTPTPAAPPIWANHDRTNGHARQRVDAPHDPMLDPQRHASADDPATTRRT